MMGSIGSVSSRSASTKNSELINRKASVQLLFSLPGDIALRILCELLDWNDIARLDVALCSPKQLAEVITLQNVTSTAIPRIREGQNQSYETWAIARGIQINHLCVELSSQISSRTLKLMRIARNLTSLLIKGRMAAPGCEPFVALFHSTLVKLQLHNCALQPPFHDAIITCPHLAHLTLSSCKGSWIMRGDGYPSLRELRISGLPWRVMWRSSCSMPLPNLQRLHMGGLIARDAETIQTLIEAGKGEHMEALELENVQGAHHVLTSVTLRNRRIGCLLLTDCHNQDNNVLYTAFYWCRRIHTLQLSRMLFTFPSALHSAVEMCEASLTSLDLSYSCFTQSDDLIKALRFAPALRVLNLRNHKFAVPVEQVLSLPLICLEQLHLHGTPVSDNTIETIVRMSPSLRILNISCPPKPWNGPRIRYTAAGVQAALRSLPDLRQLGIDLPVQREWVIAYPRVRIE